MNVKDFTLDKTALLFFDILNGYVPEPEPGKPRILKPWLQNAIKLSKVGRAAGLPVFFAKGNHRPDGATNAAILTDTTLAQWRGDENQNARYRRRQKLRRARRPGTQA
jgi:nicotinamidase-related amidase